MYTYALSLIKRYKWEVVLRLAFNRYDLAAYTEASDKMLAGLGCKYSDLQPAPERIPISLVYAESHPSAWKWYRIWSGIRMTGCWPSYLYNEQVCPETLDA